MLWHISLGIIFAKKFMVIFLFLFFPRMCAFRSEFYPKSDQVKLRRVIKICIYMNKQFFIYLSILCVQHKFLFMFMSMFMLIIFNYNSRVFTYICPPNFLLWAFDLKFDFELLGCTKRKTLYCNKAIVTQRNFSGKRN